MTRFPKALHGICLPRLVAVLLFVALWALQPAHAQQRESMSAFTFSDAIPSARDGYFLTGLDRIHFSDTGESRFQKSGRVLKETIGGPVAWGSELADIALFPAREPVIFASAAIGVGVLVANDYALTRAYQDYVEPAFDWFTPKPIIPRTQTVFPAFNSLSYEDQYMLLGFGLSYAYGFAFNDERAQVAAVLSAKAVAYSYLTTQLILKPVFGRLRPVGNLSSYSGDLAADEVNGFSTNPYQFGKSPGIQFGPEKVGTAMPSYHYTQYFSVARVYSGIYDNSWVPYAVAGVAAVSNIRGHRHWVGDMVAGAVVGTVIGQSVLDNYAERRGINMNVMPMVSTSGVGATLTMNF